MTSWQERRFKWHQPDKRCHTGAGSRHFRKKKGIELSEEEATLTTETRKPSHARHKSRRTNSDETFTSIPPSELEYGEDEPEDEEPDKSRLREVAFEDIDMTVHTIRKESPSGEEMRHAGKVMTNWTGQSFYDKITERLTDEAMSVRGLQRRWQVFVEEFEHDRDTTKKERCS